MRKTLETANYPCANLIIDKFAPIVEIFLLMSIELWGWGKKPGILIFFSCLEFYSKKKQTKSNQIFLKFYLQNRLGGNNRTKDKGTHLCKFNNWRLCMGASRGNYLIFLSVSNNFHLIDLFFFLLLFASHMYSVN